MYKRQVSGYLLSNGTVLLESEKDENGFYVGGDYVNGEYLKSQERYEPVRNEKDVYKRQGGCHR